MSEETKQEKCVIIGSGPAGYTAAIYAARANLKPIVFTGREPGGQLVQTTDVDNFPGYPDGVVGPDLMEDLRKQAERFGTRVEYELIGKVDFDSHPHKLWTEGGREIHADTVVIATGATAKWLGIEGEQRLMNKGVSACAVCDGFFFKGMEVVVVGGGDTAVEEATYLAKLCPKVHLLVRRDVLRASKIMRKRIKAAENIEIHWNTNALEVQGKDEVEAILVRNNKTEEESVIKAQGFFVAIGHKPNTDIFKGILDMEDTGYLNTMPGSTHTNIEGVFAAGDVQDHKYRQAVTAAGTGCMAALDAEMYLAEKEVG